MGKKVVKINVTFESLIQFWCPSRFRILRTISLYFMKKYKKPDTLAVIDNYNFCDTQTDVATIWPTPPRRTKNQEEPRQEEKNGLKIYKLILM